LASPALKELYVQQPPQALSGALGVIADAALSADAALLVVGSANADGFVPCARLSKRSLTLRAEGAWDDLAPTLIELLALPADPEVEGASLLC
jgi:bisphosphoglycerate-independent phosphoglycerate mutase (AlkP superfamily)